MISIGFLLAPLLHGIGSNAKKGREMPRKRRPSDFERRLFDLPARARLAERTPVSAAHFDLVASW